METIHISTSKEVFSEFNKLKINTLWVKRHNYYLTLQLVKDGYIMGKPKKYTFESLNLLDIFFRLFSNEDNIKTLGS